MARTKKVSWPLMFHQRFHPSSLQDSFGQFAVHRRRVPLIDDNELSEFVHHGCRKLALLGYRRNVLGGNYAMEYGGPGSFGGIPRTCYDQLSNF